MIYQYKCLQKSSTIITRLSQNEARQPSKDTMDTMVTNVFGILCIFMYHLAGWFFPSEVILKSMY